nr:hypothetical protein [Tanacetum cinerariifolium]
GGGALHVVSIGRQAEQRHLGPNQRTVGFIEVQQLQARVIAGVFQVLADQTARQALKATVLQVHCQETDVGVDVGHTERLVEFDAVENHDLAVNQRDVAQVDIAVAFADEAFGLALTQQRLQALVAGLGPGFEGVQLNEIGLF